MNAEQPSAEVVKGSWWRVLGRGCVNCLLASMLVLMLVQAVPNVPQFIYRPLSSFCNRVGCWQDPWSMFAPDPDAANHHLRAAIWYWDGTSATWDAPRWDERSLWRKFVGARELEYFDAVEAPYCEPAWPGLARYVAEQMRAGPAAAQRPKRVEIWVDWRVVADPDKEGWKPYSDPIPLEKSSLLYEEDFP